MKERVNVMFNALAVRMKQNLMKHLLYFGGQNANSLDPDETAFYAIICCVSEYMQQTTSTDKVFEPFSNRN